MPLQQATLRHRQCIVVAGDHVIQHVRKPQPEQRVPNEVTIAIGNNLRQLRLAPALTQEQLAYSAEVERSRISKLESGLVNPSVLTLATICHAWA